MMKFILENVDLIMKKLFASVCLALSLMPSAFAETPEMIREFYTSKVDAGLGLETTFKAQAIKTTSSSGSTWLIRVVMYSDAANGLVGIIRPDFLLTVEQAKRMHSICTSLINSLEEAKANTADAFEKRIGVLNEFDLVYRHYKKPNVVEEFWVSKPDVVTSDYGNAIILDRATFERLTKALGTAIEKAGSEI